MPTFHELTGRQEGYIAEVQEDGHCKCGFIMIPSIQKPLYFHEKWSGILSKDTPKIKEGTKVQFSIEHDRSNKRYYAKDIFIQVSLEF